MKRFSLLISAVLVALAVTSPGRTFTNTAGKTLEAEVVRATATTVTLRLKNKRTSKIKLATLSKADQDYVKEWLANMVPRLRFTPSMVRSNKDENEGFFYSDKQVQTRALKVEIENEENAKGLEDSTMKYILIGRSISKRKTYKIMAIQTATFSLAPGGETVIPFKKVMNSYYDDSSYSSRTGYKIVGYVLFAERKSDKREIYTYASMPQFKNAIYSIISLKKGAITDESFQKPDVQRIGEEAGIGGERGGKKEEDVIVVE